jgi:hypothetical protein
VIGSIVYRLSGLVTHRDAAAAQCLPHHAETERAEIMLHLARNVAEIGAIQAPPRFEYDRIIHFGIGEVGGSSLTDGWYPQETWGIWIRGFAARLHFTVPPASGAPDKDPTTTGCSGSV